MSENLMIQIPPEIVPGSEKVKLHVYGEVSFFTSNNAQNKYFNFLVVE